MFNDIVNKIIDKIYIEINKPENMDKIEKNIILPFLKRCYYKLGNYIVFIFLLMIFQFIIIFYILIILLNKTNSFYIT